jgi:hypothetical protein
MNPLLIQAGTGIIATVNEKLGLLEVTIVSLATVVAAGIGLYVAHRRRWTITGIILGILAAGLLIWGVISGADYVQSLIDSEFSAAGR